MSKIKNPQEKKRLSYEKDHIYRAESQQAFRRTWPLIKAWSKRHERRTVRQIAAQLAEEGTDDERADLALRPVRPDWIRKQAHVTPLGEGIEDRLTRRAYQSVGYLLRQPYSPKKGARFAVLLEALMQSRKLPVRRAYATVLDDWLQFFDGRSRYSSVVHRKWLGDFFAHYPEWESRLREWVNSVLSQD